MFDVDYSNDENRMQREPEGNHSENKQRKRHETLAAVP
jgi:hypothetical protein